MKNIKLIVGVSVCAVILMTCSGVRKYISGSFHRLNNIAEKHAEETFVIDNMKDNNIKLQNNCDALQQTLAALIKNALKLKVNINMTEEDIKVLKNELKETNDLNAFNNLKSKYVFMTNSLNLAKCQLTNIDNQINNTRKTLNMQRTLAKNNSRKIDEVERTIGIAKELEANNKLLKECASFKSELEFACEDIKDKYNEAHLENKYLNAELQLTCDETTDINEMEAFKQSL